MSKHDLRLFLQFCRFGIVGLTAAIIHYSVVVILVRNISIQPLTANVFGFLTAFQMSYWGHRLWTFNDTVESHRDALPKLLMVQIFFFAVNETLYSLLLSLGLAYNAALIIVLAILPIFTFIFSKRWVFRSRAG